MSHMIYCMIDWHLQQTCWGCPVSKTKGKLKKTCWKHVLSMWTLLQAWNDRIFTGIQILGDFLHIMLGSKPYHNKIRSGSVLFLRFLEITLMPALSDYPPTFARQNSSSYSSYEDDIDTNRILIQKSTTLKGQTKLSVWTPYLPRGERARLPYVCETCSQNNSDL